MKFFERVRNLIKKIRHGRRKCHCVLDDKSFEKVFGHKRKDSTYKIRKGFGYSIENWWKG
jgi:hypothetical protein